MSISWTYGLTWYWPADPHPLTYLLTSWSTVLLKKLAGFQLVKRFPALYGTRRYINPFTSARHLSLSWDISMQSIPPHPTSWTSTLILASNLRLGLPSGLFQTDFSTKTLYMPLMSPIQTTCPAHLILLDFITRTILGEIYPSSSRKDRLSHDSLSFTTTETRNFDLNINQLDALNFIMRLFHACTCFEHTYSSSGGQNCTIQPLVSSHWNKWVV